MESVIVYCSASTALCFKNIIYQTLPHLATTRQFLRNVSYCKDSPKVVQKEIKNSVASTMLEP